MLVGLLYFGRLLLSMPFQTLPYERNIVHDRTLKPSTIKRYEPVINKYLSKLTDDIRAYNKDRIKDYLNTFTAHRSGHYAYLLLKRVFADEFEKGNIPRNPIGTLKNPFNKLVTKGEWLNVEFQQQLFPLLDTLEIGEEMLFILMTGARRGECFNSKIIFEKNMVFIDGTKTKSATRYVPISQKYCDRLKANWDKMFLQPPLYYSKKCTEILTSLGASGKSLHSLRHTFSSNLYYLGIDPKKHQQIMGHSSIQMTYDVYTSFDMSVSKADILAIYLDFYPIF